MRDLEKHTGSVDWSVSQKGTNLVFMAVPYEKDYKIRTCILSELHISCSFYINQLRWIMTNIYWLSFLSGKDTPPISSHRINSDSFIRSLHQRHLLNHTDLKLLVKFCYSYCQHTSIYSGERGQYSFITVLYQICPEEQTLLGRYNICSHYRLRKSIPSCYFTRLQLIAPPHVCRQFTQKIVILEPS